MPKEWDDIYQALLKKGMKPGKAGAIATSKSGWERAKGGGWTRTKKAKKKGRK